MKNKSNTIRTVVSMITLLITSCVAPNAVFSQVVGNPNDQATRKSPGAESALIKETRAYEQTLRGLAEEAQKIVASMPEKPEELKDEFENLESVLVKSRKVLSDLLAKKPAVEAQAGNVLKSAAEVRQAFSDLSKRIDDAVAQIRNHTNDNPQATETAAQAMLSIKTASEHGEKAITPLRELVLDTQRQAQGIYTELELYPQVFDFAIEACRLYKKGIGEPASYAAVVQGLWKARENLRSIILTFTYAAQKAEETIKNIPKVPSGSATPIPQPPSGLLPPVPTSTQVF